MNVCRNLPTGFNCLDIILGENLRDLDGNLTDVQRGFSIGTQTVIASEQAAGKTTFTMESMVYPIKLGYPCHKIVIFDTDGNVYKRNRLLKLTHFTEEELDKYVKVYNTNVIEDIIKALQKEQEEYMSMKYKPVKFFDHIRQEEVKMMPYVTVIMDTVTSMTPRDMDIEGAGRIVGVNFVTKDKLNPKNIYFDLITMGNGDQIKTSQGGVDTFQIPLWLHSLSTFTYITSVIKSTLNKDNASTYNIEIVYG